MSRLYEPGVWFRYSSGEKLVRCMDGQRVAYSTVAWTRLAAGQAVALERRISWTL